MPLNTPSALLRLGHPLLTLLYCVTLPFAGSNVVNGGSTHQVLSPMAVTTFQVNPNNGQPAIIDPALISQYSGKLLAVNSDVSVDIFI